MPSEFSLQPRSLKDLDRQKEFRQFLLYTGPMVLQDIISDNAYEHFLALSITLTILLQSDDQNRCHSLCITYITCYIYQMAAFIIAAHLTQFPAFPLKIFCNDLKKLCKLSNFKKSWKYLDPCQISS